MTLTTTKMTFNVMMSLTLMTPVRCTHFRGAHFWFQPADAWTPDQPVVSYIACILLAQEIENI